MATAGAEAVCHIGVTGRRGNDPATEEALVSRSFVHSFRVLFDLPILRQRREQFDHDRAMGDPRVAAEHRIAHHRSLDQNGTGCPFCGRPSAW